MLAISLPIGVRTLLRLFSDHNLFSLLSLIFIGCGSALDGGSGNSIITVECGSNSDCLNDAVCQCDISYFTPSGNHTDCQPSTGIILL